MKKIAHDQMEKKFEKIMKETNVRGTRPKEKKVEKLMKGTIKGGILYIKKQWDVRSQVM